MAHNDSHKQEHDSGQDDLQTVSGPVKPSGYCLVIVILKGCS